jgi:hypothetical protein
LVCGAQGVSESFQANKHRIMDPTTPPQSPKRQEFNTIKRGHFFDAYDRKQKNTSLRSICRRPRINIPPSTARRWLTQRDTLGSPALRRTRKLASRLGRKSEVSASVLSTITDLENPIHKKLYKEQVKELGLLVTAQTLHCHAAQSGAKIFEKPYTLEIQTRTRVNGSNMAKIIGMRPSRRIGSGPGLQTKSTLTQQSSRMLQSLSFVIQAHNVALSLLKRQKPQVLASSSTLPPVTVSGHMI